VDVTFARARESGAFAAGLRVAINVSPIQLRVPGFAALVAMQLDRHEVPARLVTIEVTEAILVAGRRPALRTLAEPGRPRASTSRSTTSAPATPRSATSGGCRCRC
jgi:EAL domain-containing protein (putative c-di-GMP-specific phosphodiesterase class I)